MKVQSGVPAPSVPRPASAVSPRLERLVRPPRPSELDSAVPEAGHSGAAAADETCELCAAPIPARHRHLLELEVERLRCVCTACSLLFDRRQAAMGRYRLVPDRVWRLDGFQLDEQRWSDLSIPVGLAYLVWSSRENRVRGFYPGALGAVESRLGLEAWAALGRENPVLGALEPDVEALLVRRLSTVQDCWLVPLTTCFELAALLRTRWRGLTGGERVWHEVGRFFEELAERARPVDREGRRIEATQSAAAV